MATKAVRIRQTKLNPMINKVVSRHYKPRERLFPIRGTYQITTSWEIDTQIFDELAVDQPTLLKLNDALKAIEDEGAERLAMAIITAENDARDAQQQFQGKQLKRQLKDIFAHMETELKSVFRELQVQMDAAAWDQYLKYKKIRKEAKKYQRLAKFKFAATAASAAVSTTSAIVTAPTGVGLAMSIAGTTVALASLRKQFMDMRADATKVYDSLVEGFSTVHERLSEQATARNKAAEAAIQTVELVASWDIGSLSSLKGDLKLFKGKLKKAEASGGKLSRQLAQLLDEQEQCRRELRDYARQLKHVGFKLPLWFRQLAQAMEDLQEATAQEIDRITEVYTQTEAMLSTVPHFERALETLKADAGAFLNHYEKFVKVVMITSGFGSIDDEVELIFTVAEAVLDLAEEV